MDARRRAPLRRGPNAQNNPAREAFGSPARFYFLPSSGSLFGGGVHPSHRPMATVFLDLYGVLVDGRVMEAAYSERMAAIFHREFGGDLATWRRVQEESYVRYQAQGAALDRRDGRDREGEPWVRAVWDINADQVRFVLNRMGVSVPPDLLPYAERVEEETVRGIDAIFPDVRPALDALRAAGHRLFLSTNANRSNAESALIGGGIRDAFDGLAMLETARAKKDRAHYWRRALELAATRESVVVVDDEARYLVPPGEMGARCVQVIRPGRPRGRGAFPVIDSLAALPDFVGTV